MRLLPSRALGLRHPLHVLALARSHCAVTRGMPGLGALLCSPIRGVTLPVAHTRAAPATPRLRQPPIQPLLCPAWLARGRRGPCAARVRGPCIRAWKLGGRRARGRAAGRSGVHHKPEQRAAQQRDGAHAAQHAAARCAHRLRPGAPLRHRHELSQTCLTTPAVRCRAKAYQIRRRKTEETTDQRQHATQNHVEKSMAT